MNRVLAGDSRPLRFPVVREPEMGSHPPDWEFQDGIENCAGPDQFEGALSRLRHTAITNLCESGASEEAIMAIAGHVSREMLSRYAHIRTEAKCRALEAISNRKVEVPAAEKAAS